MKHIFCLMTGLLFVFSNVNAQKKQVHWSELDNFHGKIFQRNHTEPFTGVAFDEHEPGKKKGVIPFKDGYIDGKAVEWDRHGNKISETTYVKGKKQGKEVVYHENGKKQTEVHYENDEPHGMVIEYYDTGEKMSSGELVNGVENGVYTWWYKNGQKDQELTYNMGKVNGQVTNWYEKGTLKMVANYRNHLQDGIITNWYENENVMSKQKFSQGIEQDTSSFWMQNGRLKEQKVYNRSGEMIDHMSYREASILTKDGYIHVFNKLGSNFILSLKGKKVDLVETPVLAFYIDGVLVQIYTYPVSEFADPNRKDASISALQGLKTFDVTELEKAISGDSTNIKLEVTEEVLKNNAGKEMLFWKFPSPGYTAEKQLTLKEEQYLGMIVQDHILLLNGMVFKANTTEEVKKALIQLSNQIELKDKPIDIIDVSEKMKIRP
jgi:antitoxin component YwqK of YwqJK toxin-antitoxin module